MSSYELKIHNNGNELMFEPPHQPVNRVAGDTVQFWWEREDGLIRSVLVDLRGNLVIEQSYPREMCEEDVLKLIEQAKEYAIDG